MILYVSWYIGLGPHDCRATERGLFDIQKDRWLTVYGNWGMG